MPTPLRIEFTEASDPVMNCDSVANTLQCSRAGLANPNEPCSLESKKVSTTRLGKGATKATCYRAVGLLCFLFTTAFAHADTIYVASTSNNTIVKFDSNGVGTAFASSGSDIYLGLAFNGSGILHVASWNNSAVKKYDSSGQGTLITNTDLIQPTGLAFDSGGNLYVSCYYSNTILKFDSNGNGSIFANTDLSRPEGLSFDGSGNLYVANFGNSTIYKFGTNGLGTLFANTGLSGPDGLAFDKGGNLYAANFNDNSIWRFDSNGVGTIFASTGLDGPDGLAFDSSGSLYVANLRSDSIVKFDTNGVGSVFASSGLNRPSFLAIGPDVHELIITSITVTNVGGTASIRLVWKGAPGSNEIQVSSGAAGDYTNAFSTVGSVVLSDTGITNYTDVGGATHSPARYYRIRGPQQQTSLFSGTSQGASTISADSSDASRTAAQSRPSSRITTGQARQHIGETTTVCGLVAGAKYVDSLSGRPTFLDFDRPYPEQSFEVVIWGPDRAKFKAPPEAECSGKTVCVTGLITEYRGKVQIVVEDPSQIVIK